MSVLNERVTPASDVHHYETLAQLQHIMNNPELYANWEQQVADLHVKLRNMNEAKSVDLYALWLVCTWEGLAKTAGVEL